MYTRENFESHMEDFEAGEMSRIPLDSVILMLREMMSDDSVTKVLLDCLEPPNLSTIDRSFKSLYDSHFITTPDDTCQVTRLGSFVTALGIDLALGSVIGLGIQMGVGAEAIQLAGVLSFPKSPWVITNPLIHGDSEYNGKMQRWAATLFDPIHAYRFSP
jgi:ATP-dependent RNA helicase DHX57